MVTMQMPDVPDEWVEEADRRNLSLGEYGRRMIRAGRRQFGHDYEPAATPTDPKTLQLDASTRSEVETQLKTWIHTNLSTDQALDIEDLLDLLEDDLAELADELCDENKAKYRRSAGGYIKTDE
ncbi:hypothetical protein EGH22_16335 [Halomicroarcula sp. F28]|uniref:DUF5805 domain-containing protein n=1 Tax=Haloarcula salinisoli TaxID=2487746 RepID=UPI001C72F622|nr:DUF5805 domain-containing protein [Halomicroarcula salinisoli]MBX0287904.1 hypothetical protein [Halomicroarcula salinisoli]